MFNKDHSSKRIVVCKEVGPRVTLKLIKQKNTLFGDKNNSELFKWKPRMQTDRKKF